MFIFSLSFSACLLYSVMLIVLTFLSIIFLFISFYFCYFPREDF